MLGTESLYTPEPLFTTEQVRALDQCAINDHGIPGITLMARAAQATLRHVLEAWPAPQRLQIFCGTGNNGGDGFLIADLAHKRGIPVSVFQLGDSAKITGDALAAREQALSNGVQIATFAAAALVDDGVIIDAMLGTGLGGDVRADVAQAIEAINASAAPVVAVDIPSGICGDTGAILGAAVEADLTVTFIGLKRGLFTFQAPDYTGAVVFSDLAIPMAAYSSVSSHCSRLELEALLERLVDRPVTAHKGLYGKVLVVGGDYGMAGAAAMAAEAALRCGAGLVQVATRREHIGAVVARTPEVMPHGVDSKAEFEALLDTAQVLVVGPGLGQGDWSRQLLHRALASEKAIVLDADALNLLAEGSLDVQLPRENWVLTPHPGEAARLLGISTAEVQADRFAALTALQSRFGGVVILKGNGTLISAGGEQLLSDYGNPGMASGGMGDVLSGVIGAFLGQQLPPLEAAALAVCLHGAAADIAAQEGQRGLVATDLMQPMRALLG